MSHLQTEPGSSENLTTASTSSFTVPATATFAVVFVGMRGGDGDQTTLDSVTMGGESFTLDNSVLRLWTSSFQGMEAGYLLAADMPSGTVTATATRLEQKNGMTITVMFFDDAAQQIPTIGLHGDPSGGDPFDTSITMPSAGIMADGILTTSGTFTTNQTGQTQRDNTNSTADAETWASTREVSSGSQTMGWDTNGNTVRTTHIVLGIEEEGSSATITPTDVTPNDGDLQTITPAGMTGPITAASISGLDILADLSSTDPSSPITFTVDVSALATSETSSGFPRIGQTSTISFTTATDGAVTTDITMQPKTGWAVEDLAATLVKGVNDYLTLVDAENSITTAIGNQNYYKQLYGESITPQGVYTGGTLVAYQYTEYVIQQGGSATTTATSYGEKFYPFGTGPVLDAPILASTKALGGIIDVAFSRQLIQTGGDTATSWAINGGADQAQYSITNGGVLSRDVPNPTEEAEVVTVAATNSGGTSNTQTITITYAEAGTGGKQTSINISSIRIGI